MALLIGSISASKVIARPAAKDIWAEEAQTRARELWEEAIVAKGGRKRLREVKSLYIAIEHGGGERAHELYVFPDLRFDYAYWPYRETTNVHLYNGNRKITWWQNNDNPAQPRESTEDDAYLNLFPHFVYLLVTASMEPTPLRSRKGRVGLKQVDVVETEANGWRVDYFLDSTTHLPIKVALPWGPRARAKGEMDQQVELEDYAEIDGVMMPRKATHSFTTSPRRWKERLKFEINPAYDPQIFEQPPTPKVGPESWRAKKVNTAGPARSAPDR